MTLGTFCEALASDETFNTLVRHFEISSYQTFMSTAAGDKTGREQLYAELQGLRGFLGLMQALVERKTELLNPAPSPDDDALSYDD